MAFIYNFVLLFILSHLSGTVTFLFSDKVLYKEGDDIILLNVTNFNDTVFGKQNAWMIEFYNSWCGHCISFAPTWIELAHDVKAWHPVINVAAINCADEPNVPVCRKYGANTYPSIKFLRANAEQGQTITAYRGERTIQLLQEAMIDYVSSKDAYGPPTWPRLEPINYFDMNSLFRDVPTNISLAAILVDVSKSYLGKTVILDTLNLTSNVRVFWATKESSPLIESFKEISVPFLIVAKRSGRVETFSTDSENVRFGFVDHLNELVGNNASDKHTHVVATPETLVLPGAVPIIETLNVPNELDRVHLRDLENVLHYVLFQEVALHNEISGDKLDALKAFLGVLAKYLPGKTKTVVLLKRLDLWVNNQTSSISVDSFENKLNEIQNSLSINLKMNLWIGCRGSQRRFRGYPCGLWTTFHTLTVYAYNHRKEERSYDPLEVMIAIRKYVINYFGCENCAQHFAEMSANIENEIKNHEDLVLWLWQAHNKVNARLKGDPSEDPIHPKRQFPTAEMCPNCRLEDETQWDLVEVLDFLVRHYSKDGIVGLREAYIQNDTNKAKIMAQALIRSDVSIPLKPKSENGGSADEKRDVRKHGAQYELPSSASFFRWSFSRSDISICVLLYVSSILLLLLCYFFILTRRRSLFASLRSKKHFYL